MSVAEVRDQKSEISRRRACIDRIEATPAATLAASHHAHHASHARTAFSLVEMMVVIAIVVLLFALTIGVVTSLSRSAETRTTQDALSILDQAYEEWKRNAERDVTYGIDGQPPQPTGTITYEIQQDILPFSPDDNDHEATDELIDIIHRNAQSRDLLSKINPELLIKHPEPEDDITMIDAWDGEILTVHAGRLWVDGFDPAGPTGPPGTRDVDGTIRTEFENAFGFCTNRRLRFVSAGPDGKFGDLTVAVGMPARDEANDNIYSYPLEKEATP
jgi:prepilin-type N-terminal cleavage/methylation domain-containing protein